MTLNPKHNLLVVCLLLFVFISCKKADRFYDTLKNLPQINNSYQYAYKTAYVIGDTMVITGSLQPKNNLNITIGGIAATIVKTASVTYIPSDTTTAMMDQISLLITKQMEGKAREVKVTSGGYSTIGASIDVYSEGGPGSFMDSLRAMPLKTFSDNQSVFLYCLNGKGSVYYYAAATKDLRHIKKDGTEEVLFDLSKSLDPTTSVLVNTFYAGGVDPQEDNLYFSVRTNTGYRFLKLNLKTKEISTLNKSIALSAPYEGTIDKINIIISGVYPDSKGNLYLSVGLGNNAITLNNGEQFRPDAIASYNAVSGKLIYLYKQVTQSGNIYTGMPGTIFLSHSGTVAELKFSPDENLLYVLEYDGIEVYNLGARTLLQSLSTGLAGVTSPYDVIAPFSGFKISLGGGLLIDKSFGYLPMPGRRLQTLLYQSTSDLPDQPAKYSFPKWIVLDFNDQRTYAYAPGRFNREGFIFQPTHNLSPRINILDALLNYDEDGNLYMTANGKTALIKTQTFH